MYTRRMLVDRHLEAGTPVPQVRIKIDAQIILRHYLDLALEAACDHAISRLPSAAQAMCGGLRRSDLAQLPGPLANDVGGGLPRQPCRRRIPPNGEGKDMEICERQGV